MFKYGRTKSLCIITLNYFCLKVDMYNVQTHNVLII